MLMQKHYDRKVVKVREIDCVESPWGAHYSIYEDRYGRMYHDEDDGSDQIVRTNAETLQDALNDLAAYFRAVSEEV